MISYKVRVWKIMVNTLQNKKKSYTVRWSVGGKPAPSRTFGGRALADSFRTDLKKAVAEGEPFDMETGLPPSMTIAVVGKSWLAFALDYVQMKWADASGHARRGMIESLVTVTVVLVDPEASCPVDTGVLRKAVAAFLTPDEEPEADVDTKEALRWLDDNSLAVSSLADAATARLGLDATGRLLDGKAAAPKTKQRKRAVFYNALEYAIEKGHLEHNPVDRLRVKTRRKRVADTVDRRVVANPLQVRSLLIAVSMVGDRIRDRGLRLVAFFACLYFAGMRPGEAAGLREQDCHLPVSGWGRLTLERTATDVGKRWTDSGERHERRGLKHRADSETRSVPIPPELVALLVWHIATFGVASDGRLFRSTKGGVIGSTTYAKVWAAARRLAFTPAQVLSPLAVRPYDLRHAAVSLWLNSGVPATEVADRAGQSVEVLLRIYAKCIDGDEAIMNRRIELALDA